MTSGLAPETVKDGSVPALFLLLVVSGGHLEVLGL